MAAKALAGLLVLLVAPVCRPSGFEDRVHLEAAVLGSVTRYIHAYEDQQLARDIGLPGGTHDVPRRELVRTTTVLPKYVGFRGTPCGL